MGGSRGGGGEKAVAITYHGNDIVADAKEMSSLAERRNNANITYEGTKGNCSNDDDAAGEGDNTNHERDDNQAKSSSDDTHNHHTAAIDTKIDKQQQSR